MNSATQGEGADDCVIPGPVEPEALERYLFKRSPFDGADEVRRYVELESGEEAVNYLEKLSTERVIGRDHETWDVHTTGERYWVITNPTNLYSQRLFPSADYTLTFHVGLTARIASRRRADVEEDEQSRLVAAWRRWEQAGEALDAAREAEEFQAVGMRCRECLLVLVRSIADESMVPPGQERPKAGDFVQWSENIADALASGSSAKQMRSYLKGLAKSCWQLVSWLTHAANAVRFDAEMAVEATQATLAAYSTALLRFEQGVPTRCPDCSSYQVSSRYLPEKDESGSYVTVCGSCGWFDHEQARSTAADEGE
jgi:hypothetical protein